MSRSEISEHAPSLICSQYRREQYNAEILEGLQVTLTSGRQCISMMLIKAARSGHIIAAVLSSFAVSGCG